MALSSSDQQAILQTLNNYRSDPAVNASPLVWSQDLVPDAQKWADYVASTFSNFVQTGTPPPDGGPNYPHSTTTYGENIAFASPSGSSTPAQMADFWGKTRADPNKPSEYENFQPGIFPNVSKTGDWHDVGHYTQVIWGDTTSVGCAFASGGGWDILVGRFSPAGNVTGVRVPKPAPVTLAQVSVADAKNAVGVDAANNVYRFASTDGTGWTKTSITGKQMKLVSVASDGTLCGLDTSGAIWKCDLSSSPQTWTSVPAGPTAFRHVSCGSASTIWAVGTDYIYYKYTTSGWTQGAPGYGYQVSVSSDGTVVGLGTNNGYYQRTASDPPGTGWMGMDAGTVAQLSCGSATNIWAVAQDGSFLNYPGGKRTQAVPGSTGKQVSVASSDGTVWSIGTNNQVSRLVNSAWSPLLI